MLFSSWWTCSWSQGNWMTYLITKQVREPWNLAIGFELAYICKLLVSWCIGLSWILAGRVGYVFLVYGSCILITISLAVVSVSSETKTVKVNIILCACVGPLMLSHCTMRPTVYLNTTLYNIFENYCGEIVTWRMAARISVCLLHTQHENYRCCYKQHILVCQNHCHQKRLSSSQTLGYSSLQCPYWPAPIAAAPPPWLYSSSLPPPAQLFAAVAFYLALQPLTPVVSQPPEG